MATTPPPTAEATTTADEAAPARPQPPPRRRRRWLRWLAEAALLLAALLLIRAFQQQDAIEGLAPPIEGSRVDGGAVSLAAMAGRPAAVHFWGSWCSVCRAMKGNVVRFAEDHPGQVITVATRSGGPGDIRAYLEQQELLDADGRARMPVMADPVGRLAAAYGVRAFPTTFFLDAEGKVRTVEVGYTTTLGLRARLFWAGL